MTFESAVQNVSKPSLSASCKRPSAADGGGKMLTIPSFTALRDEDALRQVERDDAAVPLGEDWDWDFEVAGGATQDVGLDASQAALSLEVVDHRTYRVAGAFLQVESDRCGRVIAEPVDSGCR